MINKSEFLNTDFYQISMAFIYIMEGKANTITGFEGFVRHIKPDVSSSNTYLFDGKEVIEQYISKIKNEIVDPEFVENFIQIIKDKINVDFDWESKFRNEFSMLTKDFEYSVVNNNSTVHAYVPVFQFRGPVWIGQIIETMITNSYNGLTGLNTIRRDGNIKGKDFEYLNSIVNNVCGEYYEEYISDIKRTAKKYKKVSKNIPIFEAAFRRSCNKEIASIASKIAIENGWNGTSNTSIRDIVSMNKIGGSMAHAFVMFFETELEAFKVWYKYFPNSTILIDTYNTINAVKMIIENNIKPKDVRIDSGDFFVITQQVRDLLDAAGWYDVGIFLSGDITIDMIKRFEEESVPVDKIMAGTKYVYNNSLIRKVNSGFVYKLVEVHTDKGIVYPNKKAEGKKNYPGLKSFDFDGNVLYVNKLNADEPLNLPFIDDSDLNIKFDGGF